MQNEDNTTRIVLLAMLVIFAVWNVSLRGLCESDSLDNRGAYAAIVLLLGGAALGGCLTLLYHAR